MRSGEGRAPRWRYREGGYGGWRQVRRARCQAARSSGHPCCHMPPGRRPGSAAVRGGSRLGTASGKLVLGRDDHGEGELVAEADGRVVTAALVVVPGLGDTVTFVRQERGPYAGWWLLPGGKGEFGEPVADAARREAGGESAADLRGRGPHGPYRRFLAGHHFLVCGYSHRP